MASRKQQKRHNRRKGHANKEQPKCDPAIPPPIAMVSHAVESQNSAKARDDNAPNQDKGIKKSPPDWQLRHSRIQIFVGGGLLAFTLAQAIVGYFQWSAMRDQNDQMATQSAQMVTQSGEIAKQSKILADQTAAMTAQNKIALGQLDKMASEQRPYIDISTISLQVTPPLTISDRINVTVKNWGNTPGTVVGMVAEFKMIYPTHFNPKLPIAFEFAQFEDVDVDQIKKSLDSIVEQLRLMAVIQPSEEKIIPRLVVTNMTNVANKQHPLEKSDDSKFVMVFCYMKYRDLSGQSYGILRCFHYDADKQAFHHHPVYDRFE